MGGTPFPPLDLFLKPGSHAVAVTTAINMKGGSQIKPPPLIKSDTLVTGMSYAAVAQCRCIITA